MSIPCHAFSDAYKTKPDNFSGSDLLLEVRYFSEKKTITHLESQFCLKINLRKGLIAFRIYKYRFFPPKLK